MKKTFRSHGAALLLRETRVIWLAAVLCLTWAHASHAKVIFSENYEVQNIDDLKAHGWEVDNGTDLDGTPVMSIVPAPSGRTGRVLRMQYQGVHVDDNHNAHLYITFPGVQDLYERYFVRYDAIDSSKPSGFTNIAAKQHYWNVGTLPNLVTNFSWNDNHMDMSNQTPVAHPCPNGTNDVTCNLYANEGVVPMTYGVWHCVEAHAGPTSADLWIDGVQVLHYEKPYWVAPAAWTNMAIYRQGADNQYRYEDDFVLSTTRIGCSESAPTPPAAPTGLTVQ